MSDQLDTETNTQRNEFSADYVKQLREEAASWRTKFRELEAVTTTKDIEIGLAKRGIKAKASWVEVKDGQSIDEALDAFAQEFSSLVGNSDSEPTGPEPEPVTRSVRSVPNVPNSFTPGPTKTSNVEVKDLNEILASQSLSDVKQDPNKRAQVRDWYRSSLRARH